jgi:predicted ATPase/DNA-binding SARP family transcriptional activator
LGSVAKRVWGAQVEIRILGPVEVSADGRPVPVGGPRIRAIVALLALRANRVVPADSITAEIWPGLAPQRALPILQVRISELRRALRTAGEDDRVVTLAPGYLLRVADGELDAARFAELVGQGRGLLAASDATGAYARLNEALGLWRGSALADLADAGWARGAVARLEEARLAAVEWQIQAALGGGSDGGGDLIGVLAELTQEHPLRERLWGLRMLALYQVGRQAEALNVYRQARAGLVRDAGIEPGAELRELHARILAQDVVPAAGPARHQPPAPPGALPDSAAPLRRLPAARTSFVGRKVERDTVSDLVRTSPLVTLTGVGGGGKTRLAIAVAADLAAEFAGGPVFVDLASLSDPGPVVGAVASALDLQLTNATDQSLAAWLGDRQLLLVLDNCEHLLDGCAALADVLLSRCSRLQILATSRRPLGVTGEQLYQVPSLAIDTDAVALFAERATAARPSLSVSPVTRAVIADICQRLDGIPLAIELTAARVSHLSLGDIVDRLDDRFALLRGGSRRVPRHQTLAAAMDWSHDLLTAGERVLFRRLAVFCSPFTLAAAETIGTGAPVEQPQVLDLLAALIAQSLVTVTEAGPVLRYRMLVTVREYATERLRAAGELDQVRRVHLDYVLAAIRDVPIRPHETGTALTGTLMRPFETLQDDIQAAFEYALAAGDNAAALGIAARFGRWAWMRSRRSDGLAWAERAIASGPAEPAELYGWALYSAAAHAVGVDPDRGERLAQELISLTQRTGDHDLISAAWFVLGNAAVARRDWPEARGRLLQALRLTDHPLQIATTERNLAYIALLQGDIQAYQSSSRRAVARLRELGDTFELARTVAAAGGNLADLAGPEAQPEAAELLAEGLTLALANGYDSCVALALVGLARIAENQDRPADAVAVIGSARAFSEHVGSTLEYLMADYAATDRVAAFEARLAGLVGETELTRAGQYGRTLLPGQAARVAVP